MKPALLLLLSCLTTPVLAQHEHHAQHDTTELVQMAKIPHGHDVDSAAMPPMSHSFSLHLPMNRNGSGTGWLPDASPMYGYMMHSRKWMYMVHGNIFVRYNSQDATRVGLRGDSKVDAPSWFMAMGQRRVGQHGLLHFNTMFSLDPLFGGKGYPLLFQTGETFQGNALVDRQHPHNFFSELSVAYSYAFNHDADVFVYAAYPGEPALGPVAFMHRPSSLTNPDSPLGHHWQDATHITFGVLTAGLRYKIFKLEGSFFTGREPGENRYSFDRPSFDSYASRFSISPSRALSFQVSRSFIKSPEAQVRDENIKRTTASAIYALSLPGNNRFITSSFVWGYNDSGSHHRENSFTFEGNVQLNLLAAYGRFENVDKSADELQFSYQGKDDTFNISALTLGLNYTILQIHNTNCSIGAQGSVYRADERLSTVYGKNPKSFEVYMRISPAIIKMK